MKLRLIHMKKRCTGLSFSVVDLDLQARWSLSVAVGLFSEALLLVPHLELLWCIWCNLDIHTRRIRQPVA